MHHHIAWIHLQTHGLKKIYKKEKIPEIIPTKNQASPRQVQHRSPRNGSTNFLTQPAQNLVTHHMLKSLHYFHIYKNKGKEETIDILLVGSNIDTWRKEVEK